MIWKLLKRNISAWQIAGYAVSTLVGAIIVMAAIQFYADLGGAISGKNSADGGISITSPRNLVISKPVGLTSTLSGSAPTFSSHEIEEITQQPWVKSVSPFQASDYNVWASASLGGRGLSTALFFESIPKHLIDRSIEDFTFDPDDPFIPIVLSKDYLALYNFGFAASGRMPVVSESIISSIPLEVTLGGNGHYGTYPARIVGFSSWLNTIAVPQEFMDWAHEIYGSGKMESPSRLVIETSDQADPSIEPFMEANGYEIAGPDDNSSRATRLLRIVTAATAAVGGIISLLALFILMLSLFLLVQKNGNAIRGLILLGYHPGKIALCYIRLICIVNGGILIISAATLAGVKQLWSDALEALGGTPSPLWGAIGAGAALLAVITGINCLTIKRLVNKFF
ncbi:MAG: hypothetical protein NC405_03060 [Odoribacter sp.]|nr:hypothetical protein [Odoribacter sp.]